MLAWPADRPPRSVFMGTPAFAVPSLRAVASGTTLVGVVSQPDRPQGRGLTSQPSPVSIAASELGVPLIRPASIRTAETIDAITAWQPDLLVVAAYGKILPAALLALPTIAAINVHASLLPRYRGAAPIAASILAGDSETGVTIMLMSEVMDGGDVLLQRRIPIHATDTTASLTTALAALGSAALLDALAALCGPGLHAESQDASGVTYAPRLSKDNGRVDWQRDATTIERMVRAFTPWPSAFTTFRGHIVKLLSARVVTPDALSTGPPGTIVIVGNCVLVATGNGILEVLSMQSEGKKAMPADRFVAGARLEAGARFE